jgi:hypothetical protein
MTGVIRNMDDAPYPIFLGQMGCVRGRTTVPSGSEGKTFGRVFLGKVVFFCLDPLPSVDEEWAV